MGRGLKFGELPINGAKRGLKEETGLDAEFKILGIIRIRWYNKDHKLLNDSISHVCFANEYSGDLINKNEFGENYWIKIDDAIKLTLMASEVANAQAQILERIKTTEVQKIPFFYTEENLIIDKL